jgi:hypothetical protein
MLFDFLSITIKLFYCISKEQFKIINHFMNTRILECFTFRIGHKFFNFYVIQNELSHMKDTMEVGIIDFYKNYK